MRGARPARSSTPAGGSRGCASVEIEPLGTDPDVRRLGLARAIVREAARRAWRLGATYVLVWGTSTNPEATALYLSAGMRSRRVLRDYRSVPSA